MRWQVWAITVVILSAFLGCYCEGIHPSQLPLAAKGIIIQLLGLMLLFIIMPEKSAPEEEED